MTGTPFPPSPFAPIEEIVAELLNCGAVLSQIVSAMAQFDASNDTEPQEVPIPESAYSLIVGVLDDVRGAYRAGHRRRRPTR